ncbi:MAG: hypothetical protein JWM86_1719 [Thermoleophilia bacterium]|nr:hypothetical protein [Thermoleophilia bacterium]
MEALIVLVTIGNVWALMRSSNDRTAVAALQRRVATLEAQLAAGARAEAAPAATHAPVTATAASAAQAPAPFHQPAVPAVTPQAVTASAYSTSAPETPRVPAGPRERSQLERIVAEHTLAIVGGVFVLVAAVLFVTFAIDQGWIGPWLRFTLTLAFAAAIVAAGILVARRMPAAERTGRAIGSLHGVLAGTGVAVAFIAIVAAVRVEGLLSATAGALLEVVVGVTAVMIARRWRSQDLAAFGVCVGLAAPILVDAPAAGATIALLVASLGAAAVLAAWEQWPRLWLAAVLISAPQVASYAHPTSTSATATVLFAWWLLAVAGCVACALRDDRGARRSVISTVFVAAPVVAGRLIDLHSTYPPDERARATALALLAALHVLAAAALWLRPQARDRSIGLIVALLGAGATVAAVAIGDAAGDVASVAGWAFEAVALGVLAAHLRSRVTAGFAGAAALLAIGHALILDAPIYLLWDPSEGLAQPLGAMIVIAVAATAGRALLGSLPEFGDGARDLVRRALRVVMAVSWWYAVALAGAYGLDGAPGDDLAIAAWAAAGAIACVVVRGVDRRPEWLWLAALAVGLEAVRIELPRYESAEALWVLMPALACACALALARRADTDWEGVLGVAAAQGLLILGTVLVRVPPSALRTGDVAGLGGAALALAALVGAVWLLAAAFEAWEDAPPDTHRAAWIVRALVGWYAVSVLVVAALTSTPGDVEQSPQLALTLTWVAFGIAALLAGTSQRLRRFRELRIGGYTLLGVAAAKLVLVDTAEFETPMRVVAFLATGLGLLGSAALEQRMRGDDASPPPLP